MKTFKGICSMLTIACGLFLCFAIATTSSRAQQVISYQGSVTQNSVPVSGTHNVVVSIYPIGLNGTAIYTDTQSVAFNNGIFNMLIGSDRPLPTFEGSNQYFVGVSIDGGAELTPRSQLGAAPMVVGGNVRSLNALSGAVTLAGSGGTVITSNGQTITISSPDSSGGSGGSGITGIRNTDGTINITSPNGPTATIGLAANAVTTGTIADDAVTNSKIALRAVTSVLISSGASTNGQVLTSDGTGGAAWITPAAFSLPYSQAVSSSSTLFALANSGAGEAISGTASASYVAGVQGSTSNATGGIGVLGFASDGFGFTSSGTLGVVGLSSAGVGVLGNSFTGTGVEGFGLTTGIGILGSTGSSAVTARAGVFEITNSSATANAVEVNNAGTGSAIKAVSTSTTNSTAAILGQSSSTAGYAIAIEGEFTSTSPGSWSAAVRGKNDGTGGAGIGVWGSQAGSGWGVYGTTGSGVGVYGLASGAGTGVLAQAGNNGNALISEVDGTTASTTTANNCAIFLSGATHVARIDRTGKGFFDGGTATSGADVAEEFDVAGARASYSPGDVLVISTTGDRKVEKCSTPYSRLVVGVYATKPGVTLSDLGIDEDESARVPMGVIGVIPTNVTDEGGAITAGDLLVTSSTPGCAMKADLDKLKIGEALGKALENFSGHGMGMIKVLVGKY